MVTGAFDGLALFRRVCVRDSGELLTACLPRAACACWRGNDDTVGVAKTAIRLLFKAPEFVQSETLTCNRERPAKRQECPHNYAAAASSSRSGRCMPRPTAGGIKFVVRVGARC